MSTLVGLREKLYTAYKKLETASRKYLLPQEFYAVLLFLSIGIVALFYRGGRSLWRSLFPESNTTPTFITDSAFAALARTPDSLHFWQPEDAVATDTNKRDEPRAKKTELAPESIILNSASSADLELLPGVGAVMSQRIIAYRTARGKFTSLEELMNVSGIGAKKFERMRQYLRLN